MIETRLDVDRDSVLRLRKHALTLIQRINNDQKTTDYRRGWYDGYLRAVEHVLEMENE